MERKKQNRLLVLASHPGDLLEREKKELYDLVREVEVRHDDFARELKSMIIHSYDIRSRYELMFALLETKHN